MAITMKPKFYTPALTALHRDGALDREGNQRLYDWLLAGGIEGVVLLGSMGECFGLGTEQKRELISLAAHHLRGRARLLVGAGSTCLEETAALSRYALEQGADGVLIVPPYYFSLNEQQAEDYFGALLPRIPGKAYLYNFPTVTGYDISPELTLRLARRHPNLAGYKDTVAQTDHTARLIQLLKAEFPAFEVFCGFDNNFAHTILSGGDGCVGGMSNIIPAQCAAWRGALEAGDWTGAARYQQLMDKIVQLGKIGAPFPPIVKTAAILCGLDIQPWCTPPFFPPSGEQAGQIAALLESAGLRVQRERLPK